MEGPYGTEWPVEDKVKRRQMVAPEARYIFVYEEATELLTMSEQERCVEERGPMLGFLHFRFLIEEELPVLYVYEFQLEPRVQGKGLGKFLMQLIELIARKNHMGAVVLTVQKANLVAMNFYTNKMRRVETISLHCRMQLQEETLPVFASLRSSLRLTSAYLRLEYVGRAHDIARRDRNKDPKTSLNAHYTSKEGLYWKHIIRSRLRIKSSTYIAKAVFVKHDEFSFITSDLLDSSGPISY